MTSHEVHVYLLHPGTLGTPQTPGPVHIKEHRTMNLKTSEHQEKSAASGSASVRCAVLTVSDSRTAATDSGGDLLAGGLVQAGHRILRRELVRDEDAAIRSALEAALGTAGIEVVLLTGGTGIAPRDRTVDTVQPLFEKLLPGFGEIFRFLSFQEIGSAAMLSRACAGVIRGRMVFVLPGSRGALRLALERLIVPELNHIAGLL